MARTEESPTECCAANKCENSSAQNSSNPESSSKINTDLTNGDSKISENEVAENDDSNLAGLPDILTLEIQSPTTPFNTNDTKTLKIQVSPQEIVQELHSILQAEYSETCHRTCFSLFFNGERLDAYAEIGQIPDLQNESVLQVVEEPYNLKEARSHIKHVRQLIRTLDNYDAMHGHEMQSFSFMNVADNLPEDLIQSMLEEQEMQQKSAEASSPAQNKKNGGNRKKRNKKLKKPENAKSNLNGSGDAQPEKNEELDENLANQQINQNIVELTQLLDVQNLLGGVDCSPPEYARIPEPGTNGKEQSLTHYFPERNKVSSYYSATEFIKQLALSSWNPPPRNRQLVGDLLYVEITTCENKKFTVTCSRRGWFVNNCSSNKFDPLANGTSIYHSLVTLLINSSNKFKTAFGQMKVRRAARHVFERLPTPYQNYSWIGPKPEENDHQPIDPVRLDEMFSTRLQQEEHIPGQTRDWNEELQSSKEMPSDTLMERLVRDRSAFKSHVDFVSAATRGAIMVVDGSIAALNPGASHQNQMYLWNHIFFSFAFDCTDHFSEVGGDSAAHISPGQDLHGIKLFNQFEVKGLYTIGTVLVDYRGFRVVCQSVIPGILEREHDESVTYGSNDYGKTIALDEFYVKKLAAMKEHLQIDTVKIKANVAVAVDAKKKLGNVENGDFEPEPISKVFELPTSVETKGIRGSDDRCYLIDLQRTLPPDVNFMSEQQTGGIDPKTLKHTDFFPILTHPHKVPEHRKELVDTYYMHKYQHFMTVVYQEIERRRKQLVKEGKIKSDEKFTDSITEKDHEEILAKASKSVNSLHDVNFELAFCSDCVSPMVDICEESGELEKKRQLLRALSNHLVTRVIPKFVNDAINHCLIPENHRDSLHAQSITPIDGFELTTMFHRFGIPMRYLSYVLNQIKSKIDETEQKSEINYNSQAITELIKLEIINRAVKHVFRGFAQSLDTSELAPAIAHFLNCYLGYVKKDQLVIPTGDYGCNKLKGSNIESFMTNLSAPVKKNKVKKNQRSSRPSSRASNDDRSSSSSSSNNSSRSGSLERIGVQNVETGENEFETVYPLTGFNRLGSWQNLSTEKLWRYIGKECHSYFKFNLDAKSCEEFLNNSFQDGHKNKRTSMLRSFCKYNAVQVACREYNYSSFKKPPFQVSDITDLQPKVKFIQPRAVDAYETTRQAQKKFAENGVAEGVNLLQESLNLLQHVYGPLHEDAMALMKDIARYRWFRKTVRKLEVNNFLVSSKLSWFSYF